MLCHLFVNFILTGEPGSLLDLVIREKKKREAGEEMT